MTKELAEHNISMMRYYRQGGGQGEESDVAAVTGKKPRKFADFCKTFLKPLL